ncbi:MAG: Ribosomal RNA small subunit methyltransferase E [Syntrophus sp. PtaB.Bin075]|nr:MAG: Ribosomal RNA small subunit methyltransferase E [Syntrophus sp. PtaB.Bin075]
MTIPRLHYPGVLTVGDRCFLSEEHLHYVRSVQRMKPGSRLSLFDGRGQEYTAVIVDISAERALAEIIDRKSAPERPGRITLIQALPKGQKMDFIVQKATELGVDEILPFSSERSIPRLPPEKARLKTERWRKIAGEAARQCRRSDVPNIPEIQSFAGILEAADADSLKMIFWEEESRQGLKDLLKKFSGTRIFSILVGPEGGLTSEEVEAATAAGFVSVSLGKQILKLETAAVAILAIVQYEVGLFGIGLENAQKAVILEE